MGQQRYSVSDQTAIVVRKAEGRVTVTGWDEAGTVAVDAAARQERDTLLVEEADRVSLHVPRAAKLTIESCEADVRLEGLSGRVELIAVEGDVSLNDLSGTVLVRDLEGDLAARGVATLIGEGEWEGDVALRSVEHAQVESVEGDLALFDVGAVEVGSVGDDVLVRGGHGRLELGKVQGDVNLRGMAGAMHLDHVGGDLLASDVNGELDAPDVEGDAILALAGIAAMDLRADGDVVLHLPAGANAQIELDAPHGHVVTRAEVNATQRDPDHMAGTIGVGGPALRATSIHGDVILRTGAPAEHRPEEAFAHHFAGMGPQMAAQVRRTMEETMRDIPWRGHGHWGRFGDWFSGREHPGHWKRRERDAKKGEGERATVPVTEAARPQGPADGSAERKAILDAIARGELSVDDAIRKLTEGEG